MVTGTSDILEKGAYYMGRVLFGASFTGAMSGTIVSDYSGKGYGDFKSDVAEAVVEHIRPIREKYDQLSNDKQYLVDVYTKGAERANRIAQRTLNKVYKKIGFII